MMAGRVNIIHFHSLLKVTLLLTMSKLSSPIRHGLGIFVRDHEEDERLGVVDIRSVNAEASAPFQLDDVVLPQGFKTSITNDFGRF
jgi:hypothetical protein